MNRWKTWHKMFYDTIVKFMPWRKVYLNKTNKHPRWFTSTLYRLRRRVNRLYARWKRHPDDQQTRATYTLTRNFYRKQVRGRRHKCLSNAGYNLNRKYLKGGYVWWRKAKQLCNIHSKKQAIPELELADGKAVTAEQKASALSDHFVEQCSTNPPAPPLRHHTPSVDHADLFEFKSPTEEEVLFVLQSLPVHKSAPDLTSNYILRKCAATICPSLTLLFKESLESSTVPVDWKKAIIVPVYKGKGDAQHPTNYRPISLIPSIAKVFEKILARSLLDFLMSNRIISERQFAYVRNRSINEELTLLSQNIATTLDDHKQFDCTFLDFTKAFDRVDHGVLLNAFQQFSTKKAVLWLESYLSSRTISVRVDETLSDPKPITCGVPQGAHLAPLLFIIFINGLVGEVKHSKIFIFADDVVLLHLHNPVLTLPTNHSNFQEDITACQIWARSVHGSFSATKSINLRNYTSDHSFLIEQHTISNSSECTHLGVLLTENLDFTHHVTNLSASFCQRINLLCHMSNHLNVSSIILLYKSYVRPVLEFSAPCWYPSVTKSQLRQFDLLQARIARRICRKSQIPIEYDERKSELNKKCGLESLQFRRQTLCLVALHKIIHKFPQYLAAANLSLTSSTRRPNKLLLPKPGTISRRQFYFRTACLWNCLPPKITAIESRTTFKRYLLRHFAEHRFLCSGIPEPFAR